MTYGDIVKHHGTQWMVIQDFGDGYCLAINAEKGPMNNVQYVNLITEYPNKTVSVEKNEATEKLQAVK